MKTLLHASEPKTLTVSAAAAVASGGGRPPFPPPPLLPSLCGGGGGGASMPGAGGVHVAACAAQVHTGKCPCEGPAPAMTLATGRDTGNAQHSCVYWLLSHWGSAASCVLALWRLCHLLLARTCSCGQARTRQWLPLGSNTSPGCPAPGRRRVSVLWRMRKAGVTKFQSSTWRSPRLGAWLPGR